MSAEIPPERLLELVRSHWEDRERPPPGSRRRHGRGPECLSALPRVALNIVRLMDDDHSLKGRMHIAFTNDKYLLGLLANAGGKF